MNAVGALRLRQVSGADYETRKRVGRGLRLSGSKLDNRLDGPFDEPPSVGLTLMCDEPGGEGHASQDLTLLASRHGVCRLTNGHAVLGLLAGVPPPPAHESRLAGLFEDLCLARLSRSFLVDVAPVHPAATTTATSTSAQQDVRLILVADRGDLSAFSRASAPLAFWQALMSNDRHLPVAGPSRCRRLIVELPLVVATGVLPASVVMELAVGDVVQFETIAIRPDSTGQLQLGGQTVFYRFDATDCPETLTVEAIRSPHSRRTEPLTKGQLMNVSHEFDEFDDDHDHDDGPEPGDQPTHEEADADAAAIAPVRENTSDERTPVDIRDIDVQIVVEIGRLTVSIGELEDLQIGSVLKVSTPGVRRVTVKTIVSGGAGQTIALGELVQVDDTLAVQITRVFE